jgi:hypothetical protein
VKRIAILLVALIGGGPCAALPAFSEPLAGSAASDSLIMPTEVFVITREDLAQYNVHTLDDVLRLLPGVVFWREGPPDSYGGFSIDGRDYRGFNLLVNGSPSVDPYTLESLARFIPLSRLRRIEVIYSGSPYLTGNLSCAGAINVVIDEGGREAPATEVDFTYGGSKRRVRRAWFATPRAHIGGLVAYDEYLQDAAELYAAMPTVKLGQYDMRSVLAELDIHSPAGDDIVLRLHRFEDWYLGTALSSDEEIRTAGFNSEMTYRRAGFSGSLRQQGLTTTREAGRMESFTLAAAGKWGGNLGPVGVRAFASAERSVFDNLLWGTSFDASCRRFEGGVLLGARLPSGVTTRGGAFGGDHNVVGRYGGAELAVGKEWSERFSQSVMIARRLRIPSARELFQPLLPRALDGVADTTIGNDRLAPEISDEIALGARMPSLSVDVFARSEKSRIILVGADRAVYRAEGSGTVAGVRGRFAKGIEIAGFDCSLGAAAELYGKRSDDTPGIPAHRFTGQLSMRHRVFKGTELLTVKLDGEFVGRRSWEGTPLGAYGLLDAAASLTIMSARVSFEYRNILDAKYETVPGYLMPGRYYLMGIFWELFD